MKRLLLTINHSFLFLCASMYLGTGGSEILFTFPIEPQLTVDNYYLQFVPQVAAATKFFTGMTKLMLLSGVIMLIAEWKHGWRWVPIVVLAAVIGATVLTEVWIFPLNEQMAAGIKDNVKLHQLLGDWMQLNRVRAGFWVTQWAALMIFFGRAFFKMEKAV